MLDAASDKPYGLGVVPLVTLEEKEEEEAELAEAGLTKIHGGSTIRTGLLVTPAIESSFPGSPSYVMSSGCSSTALVNQTPANALTPTLFLLQPDFFLLFTSGGNGLDR